MQGASAVKAVQAAVNTLEDDPVFDAGKCWTGLWVIGHLYVYHNFSTQVKK